jgi:hypothetical protein
MAAGHSIVVGKGDSVQYLHLQYGNRHGLIAGATGTGKTISLQVLAEGFSRNGVPVFMADVKGDLSGVCMPGDENPKLSKRAAETGVTDYSYEGFPTIFWDLFGKKGHPIRATVSDMGPLLLSQLLGLNETQEGVLNVAFAVADDSGLLILDLKDLRALLTFVAENAKELSTEYGTVRKVSVGAIIRRLLMIEQQGGEMFFGEPALELRDLMRTDTNGFGYINVLAADTLMQYPKLYATFMLWLISELFEELPEVGDPDKPRLAFFFDEAHLLFDDAPKVLVDKVEQVARLIRSKGVGLYFVSQSPLDIPDDILGQLGNRVQHALRAFTPRDQKAVKAAAETFRPNPKFEAAQAVTELAVGEALVSMLEGDGVPGIVQRTKMRPPASRMGPITDQERRWAIEDSPVHGKYDEPVDRESAYEVLKKKAEDAAAAADEMEVPDERDYRSSERTPSREPSERKPKGRQRQSYLEAAAKSFLRSVSSSVGRQLAGSVGKQIVRGVLGSIFRGR